VKPLSHRGEMGRLHFGADENEAKSA